MRYFALLLLIPFVFSACGAAAGDDDKNYNLSTVKVIKGKDVAPMTKEKEYTAVYFWATWCTPCRLTLKKSIKQMLDTAQNDNFQILVVALSKNPEQVQQIISDAGITQTTYVVNDYTFDNALGDKLKMNKVIKSINDDVKFLNQVPVVLMLNKEGKVLGDTYHVPDIIRFLKGELK
ncbi:MAG: thioredoxin-like domain-containing protein [Flavipsychrobacter sp.]